MEIKEAEHYPRSTNSYTLRKITSAVCLLLLPTVTMRAQCALDNFAPEPNGYVQTITVQADGKILVGGEFFSFSPNGGAVTRYRLARLNPDGTVDMAFDCNVNCNTNGVPEAIVVQEGGKILIAGGFTIVGGLPRRYIARLDGTTGQVDSFSPNADNPIEAVALQADGKILVGGSFTHIGGQTRNKIARLDPVTGLADSFDPNGGAGASSVSAIAVQADGKIVVGGVFTDIGGQPRNSIARLDAATGLADSFNPSATGGSSSVLALAVQGDGKIVVGGSFTNVGGQTRRCIARLDGTTGEQPAPMFV